MTAATNRFALREDAQVLCRRTWWVFLIGGIASVVFGVFAYLQPGIALLVLSMFFATSVLVDGVMNVVGVFLMMLGYKVRNTPERLQGLRAR
jgi:uncharacterized membrane protein HdeD (DUF308 family)